MRTADRLFIQKNISLGAILITLAVTPWTTVDPINVPKLLILSTVAVGVFLSSAILILRDQKSWRNILRYVGVYFIWIIVVVVVAPGWKIQQIFGVEGRSTGFIAQVSFLVIFFVATFVADEIFLKKIWKSLIFVGLVSLFYGYIQQFDSDPVPWTNSDNPIIGFLGNSNFQSSLLGMSVCLLLPSMMKVSQKRLEGSLATIIIILFLFQIYLSGAVQGFFVAATGFCAYLLIELFTSKFKKNGPYLLALFTGFFSIVGLGLLNIGPFAKFLFTQTVMARNEYWQAAVKMTLDFPAFGVGLDSFGDWYRRSRSLEAMLRRDVMTNSAHNIFLDHFATGGLILGFLYLGLQLIVLRSIVKIIKQGSLSFFAKGIICAWVGYLAQSLISISQIGLAIWGWVMSGLIVGMASRGTPVATFTKNKSKPTENHEVSAKILIKFIAGAIIGVGIALPPFVAQANLYQALKSGSVNELISAASAFGTSSKSQVRIAFVLDQNLLSKEGLRVSSLIVRNNPNDFDAWSLIYVNKDSSTEEMQEALSNMKRLEPNKDKF